MAKLVSLPGANARRLWVPGAASRNAADGLLSQCGGLSEAKKLSSGPTTTLRYFAFTVVSYLLFAYERVRQAGALNAVPSRPHYAKYI